MKPDTPADLFLVSDYRTLMGAFVERKLALGLTNLELDDRGGLAGGYTSKLFCGSKRLGLETLGKLLKALDVRILVVPSDVKLALSQNWILPIPLRDLSEEGKKIRQGWRDKGGRMYRLKTAPRKRKAIAAMGGRAAAEARRIRKLHGKFAMMRPKTADPAILRKLERRPVKPSADRLQLRGDQLSRAAGRGDKPSDKAGPTKQG